MQECPLRGADAGTHETGCERADETPPAPRVRSYAGLDEFGLLVDDLTPGEQVLLYVTDAASQEETG